MLLQPQKWITHHLFFPKLIYLSFMKKNYITLLNPLTNELNIPKPSIAFY